MAERNWISVGYKGCFVLNCSIWFFQNNYWYIHYNFKL